MRYLNKIRITITHPSLVIKILRGASMRELSIEYWKSERQKGFPLEASALKRAMSEASKHIGSLRGITDLDDLMRRHIIPLSTNIGRKYSIFGGSVHYTSLYLITRLFCPNIVVETGVSRGVSSLTILTALYENSTGRLYSIEMAKSPAIGAFVAEQYTSRWNLVWGDARKELPGLLQRLGPIDIFVHDSEHTYSHMMFEFETAWRSLRRNGLLIVDDVSYSNAFEDFSRSVSREPLIFSKDGQSADTAGILMKL